MSDFFIYFRYERGIVCLLHENSGRKEGASTLAPHRKEEEASLCFFSSPVYPYIHNYAPSRMSPLRHPLQCSASAELPGQPAGTGTYRVFHALNYVFTLPVL